jgi:tryptophan-rich sensory protein
VLAHPSIGPWLKASSAPTELLKGDRRVALIRAIVPDFFHAAGAATALMRKGERGQLDDDLAYAHWSFGGAAVWPLPVVGMGTGAEVLGALLSHFRAAERDQRTSPLCAWLCPRRSALRLVWQLAILVTLAIAVRYVWQRRVTPSKSWAPMALWCLGAIDLLISAALLNCDSELVALRGAGLIVCLALAVAPVAMAVFRWWHRLKSSRNVASS